jgi:hypothetical protein
MRENRENRHWGKSAHEKWENWAATGGKMETWETEKKTCRRVTHGKDGLWHVGKMGA